MDRDARVHQPPDTVDEAARRAAEKIVDHVDFSSPSMFSLRQQKVEFFAEIIAAELSVHQPDVPAADDLISKEAAAVYVHETMNELIAEYHANHVTDTRTEETIRDGLVKGIRALAASPVQPWCDHCSADLNDVRHILCEKCYRRFDSDEHTRAVAGLSDDEKALYPHTLKGKDNAN